MSPRPVVNRIALLSILGSVTWLLAAGSLAAAPLEISGVYPVLAYYNDEGECGTGAVCPWAGSLWLVTYGPHCPVGGSDKLYQVTPDMKLVARPESVGGTHADRMIHRESQQLFIGTYLVDKDANVRTIPIHTMPGRLTGVARHLKDPANKIYVTDMEEALYELDVHTLATRTFIRDGFNASHFTSYFKTHKVAPPPGWDTAEVSDLFGYHGKGTCSGFGRVFYANNGWFNDRAMRDPTIPAGALAWWNEENPKNWHLIRVNQFTDITTRDGVYGNEHPDTNPIWAMGWDAQSVILSVTTNGTLWTDYRLPKGSHSYDGAHGWNTEWPRIREIGDKATFLATMHGTFWSFPADFRPGRAAGIRPRSNYLKVIGDFCEWNGRVVLGCDDSAKNEFMNKRRVKGKIKGPAKSHSNLRFVAQAELDRMGPPIGSMIVWNREDIARGQTSAPHLLAGYAHKWAWVTEGTFDIEIDEKGTDHWQPAGELHAGGTDLSALSGEWIRFRAKSACRNATLALAYRAADTRPLDGFDALPAKRIALGNDEQPLLHVNALDPKALSLSCGKKVTVTDTGDLALVDCPAAATAVPRDAPITTGVLTYDPSSILYVDDRGNRWRLPYGTPPSCCRTLAVSNSCCRTLVVSNSCCRTLSNSCCRTLAVSNSCCRTLAVSMSCAPTSPAPHRVCREICTERDHFNAGGIYYELPAENAHGFAGVRPVATHNRPIFDYCSWRGLFALSLPGELRFMAIDDVWRAGKARGFGGPLCETPVLAAAPSDPYLMNGFDKKTLALAASCDTTVTMEVDATGWGVWVPAGVYALKANTPRVESLPRALSGYWVRFTSSTDATLTTLLAYE